jgi:ABC-type transport system involved in multi-copper enzyme maturation permease subunit
MGALAVARYTLLELARRRLILFFVGIAIVFTAGLGLAPLVIPGLTTADEKTVFVLGGITKVDSIAIELCAFAVGMIVINHDLDSGAIVGILAKPITRLGYAAGKLVAALFLLLLLVAVLIAGSMLVAVIDGSDNLDTLFAFFAANAANWMLLMILVMILTVYLNNIVAAAIVVAFSFAQDQISTLHAAVENGVITDRILGGIVNSLYWVVPHPLVSNMGRAIVIAQYNVNCAANGCPGMKPSPAEYLANELARIPGASGGGEIVYWFAYLTVVCALLYVALRRKQV